MPHEILLTQPGERNAKNFFPTGLQEALSLIPHLEVRGLIPDFCGREKGEQTALLSYHCQSRQLFSTGHIQLWSTLLGRKMPGRLPCCLVLFLSRGLSSGEDPFAQKLLGTTPVACRAWDACPSLGLCNPSNTATAGSSGIRQPGPAYLRSHSCSGGSIHIIRRN